MINLLPPQYKKELKDEENLRIVYILLVSLGMFLLVLSFLLLGILLYVQGEFNSKLLLVSSFEKELALQSKTQEDLKQANEEMLAFSRIAQNQVPLAKVFTQFFADLPKDVSLSSFSFSSPKTTFLKGETVKEQAQVVLQGSSPSRDVLAMLRANLEQDTFFEDLFFPLSNFANLKGFSLSVKIKQ